MTTAELLTHLRDRDVHVWIEGDRLRFNAPRGALTPALREQLACHKDALMALLRTLQTRGAVEVIPRVPRDGRLPLSFAQQRLWLLHQLDPSSDAYNLPITLHIRGPLRVGVLARSLSEIVRRHEALRTRFRLEAGEPVQVISPITELPLPELDLRGLASGELAEQLRRQCAEESARPFDLQRDIPIRGRVLRVADEEYALLLTLHHIASDGWSIQVLNAELSTLYRAICEGQPSPLPVLPIQYADFAAWQRGWLEGKLLDQQLAYWRQQLRGVPPLELPVQNRRPATQSYRGAVVGFTLDPSTGAGVRALCRDGITPFMVLLAAFNVLLYRYSGQEDLAVGTPSAGRSRSEVEGLIGFFVNTLVVRSSLGGEPSFSELLERTRKTTIEAIANGDVPFELLVNKLQPERDLSRTPFFQVMFILQARQFSLTAGQASSDQLLPGLTVGPLDPGWRSSKFDLTLETVELDQGFAGSIEYAVDLFSPETIRRMAAHYSRLVAAAVSTPEARLGDLPMLSDDEREDALIRWNDSGQLDPEERCLHELFLEQAGKTPGAVAVIHGVSRLTYQELDLAAERVAHALRSLGVGPEDRVGVLLERTPDLLSGLLGILKAGATYVPLDPAWPRRRITHAVSDARTAVVLTHGHHVALVHELETRAVDLEALLAGGSAEAPAPASPSVAPDQVAYIIYTSGSTGLPKGVAITHRNAVALVRWAAAAYAPAELSRVLACTSICFDLSVFELFAPLCCGGAVVLADDALALAALPAAGEVTLVNTVPSAIDALLDSGGLPRFVRTLNLAGEPLRTELVDRLQAALPDAAIFDLYGPSEDTTYSTRALRQTGGAETIGRPIAGKRAYVVDPRIQLVPIGVPGEIVLAGAGTARGYFERPELTAERFVPNPFARIPGERLYRTGDRGRFRPDGSLEFLGRWDRQVKVRGHRIELDEVEACLRRQTDAVRDAAVSTWEPRPRDLQLVAYVVSRRPDAPPTAHELTARLRQELPEYQIPARFLFLDALPLTPSGKLDRKALPPPVDAALPEAPAAKPRTPVESMLTQIWAHLLEVQTVGPDDNFFELGGHSLLAVKLLHEIRDKLGRELALADLFMNPTLAQLTTLLDSAPDQRKWSPLVPIRPFGRKRPFFCATPVVGVAFPYYELARRLGKSQPFYALQPRGVDGRQRPDESIERIAEAYVRAIQARQPRGPYRIGGWSFGGLVAYEVAFQLQRAGQEVELLAIIDTPAPVAANAPSVKERLKFAVGSVGRHVAPYLRDYAYLLRHSLPRGQEGRDARPRLLQQLKDGGLSSVLTRFMESAAMARLAPGGSELLLNNTPAAQPLMRVFAANGRAVARYSPPPSELRLTLFRARKQTTKQYSDPTMGWSALARQGVDVKTLPGEHMELLRAPRVQVLADHLKALLGA